MELTLSGAAKVTGRSKSTLSRAIKSGRLSARRDDVGTFHIDPAELARVFPWTPTEPSSWRTMQHEEPPSELPSAVAVLEAKVALLEQALGREREAHAREGEAVYDLRRRLDRAEERAHAITHHSSGPPSSAGLKGLLGRFLGSR